MRLIDSHAHIDDAAFSKNRDVLIRALPYQGIQYMINPGSDLRSSRRAVELAGNYERVYAAVGTHPHEAKDYSAQVEREYVRMARECDKVVAIGEIGLDYYYEHSQPAIQKRVFVRQLEMADELDLPVVIHSRSAESDMYPILKKHLGKHGGVMHCFSGDWAAAMQYLSLGMYISIAGTVTFKNAKPTQDVAKRVPLDRLLIETDAPYLTPVPFRGKRNEPALVQYVSQKIADLRGIPEEEVAENTRENTRRLFSLPDA